MASTPCLNRRLLQAVLRAPTPLSANLHRHQTAASWVRTITSTSPHGAPAISFGVENDAVIAQYLQGSSKKPVKNNKTDKQSNFQPQKSTAAKKVEAPAASDHFEINEFLDLSRKPVPRRRSLAREVEAEVAESRSPRKQQGPRHGKEERSTGRTRTRDEQRSTKNQTFDPLQPRPKLDKWAEQKNGLREKFPEGWNPRKKLSPDAMEGIRALHEQDSVKYSTPVLAEQFRVSPEAIRRILKSKWLNKAGGGKMEERRERWAERHDRIWDAQAELGLRPQRRKERDVEDPEKFEKDLVRKEILGEI